MRRKSSPAELTVLWVALLTLPVFGTGLVSVCLPESPQPSMAFDGDDDDAGIAQVRFGDARVIVIAPAIPIVALRQPSHREDQSPVGEPLPATRSGPLVSRAPPS